MEKVNLAQILGRRLREIRLEKGLRQQDLQDRGLSYKYYQRIEEGKVNLTLRSLEKLASALEVTVLDLLKVPEVEEESLAKKRSKK
ncbi:MAG: helix-turn-helix transcriptional regulator [Deltaproteobacteria bacterium]|nr:helix-turn-helix transcriptional regulator [Deltaproteobacteria bacterium]